MKSWTIDILRQGSSLTEWWVLLCIAATLSLASYAALSKLWRRRAGLIALPLIILGTLGTIFILSIPPLRKPSIGLLWTFTLLSLLSTVFYLNLSPRLGRPRTALLLALRLIALALIIPMFFEPVARYTEKPTPHRPLYLIVDTSQSMSFPDVQGGPTRLQSAYQTLKESLPKINDNFLPTVITFDTEARELKSPAALADQTADGAATDLVAGVQLASSKTPDPDAAFILISDGIDNVNGNPTQSIQSLLAKRPLNTLRVGSDQAVSQQMLNVAVDSVDSPPHLSVGHEQQIKIHVSSTALANRVVDVKLAQIDNPDAPADLQTKSIVLTSAPDPQTLQLPYKPSSAGVHKLAAWIDPIPGERSAVDNRQEFQVIVDDPQIKVLYVEGRVRPEYPRLRRALASDSMIEVATLLQTQIGKFEAGGRVNGDPYTATRLPLTIDDFKLFDVLILGDLPASMLTPAQQENIEHFVNDGGGLLMIGGQSNFGPGNYANTPIEKALPVFVGDTSSPQETSQFVPQLTPEGITHPAMDSLLPWFGTATQPPTQTLPPLNGNVVVSRPKSAATVLLVHPGKIGPDSNPQIVLAVQRYGKGASAAFTADTTYRWDLPLAGLGQEGPFKTFWGQLVRWLAGADVHNRDKTPGIEGILSKNVYTLGESVSVRAQVRDEHGDATKYAQVTYSLQKTGAPSSAKNSLQPNPSRDGVYDANLNNLVKGAYTLTLTATKDNKPLGAQTLAFTIIPPADEMLKLAANTPLLRDLAVKTGGAAYDLSDLPKLLDDLIANDPNPVKSKQINLSLANCFRMLLASVGHPPDWDPKYDLPMQSILVISILAAEWILRRRWQLP